MSSWRAEARISKPLRIAVSGIPRGYHYPRTDGNWLQEQHKKQILSVSEAIELIEIPAHAAGATAGIEILLAEGGNTRPYPGELDQSDYRAFFTESLRWVQLCSTGFGENITAPIIDGRVLLTNAPGLHTTAIAESAVAAMLDRAKNLPQRRLDQRQRRWRQRRNDELFERTALIVGLGRIGKKIAQLCKAFSMRVIGCKKTIEPVANVDHVFALAQLGDFLPAADYVVLAAPLTGETENLLDKKALAALKPSAYLINIGRGGLADEAALIEALKQKAFAGAYLDAFCQEPLPPDHPFWSLDNVLIVPHDSHSSPYIGDRMVALFCDNLRRYIAAKPLRHLCNPARGY